MVFKVFLIVVIVLSSMGIGNVIVSSSKEHVRILGELMVGVKVIWSSMIHQGKKLHEALETASKTGLKPFFLSYAEALKRDHKKSAGEIARQLMKEDAQLSQLTKEEKGMLAELFDHISMAMIKEEIDDSMTQYFAAFEEEAQNAKKEKQKKATMVKPICLLVGLAIAIIIV